MTSLSLSLSDLSRRLRRLAGALAAIGLAGLAASPPVVLAETGQPPRLERITIDGLVPWHRAEKPIMDGEGRIRVIVDLMDEATERQLEAARPLIERFDPKRDRHNPQALLAIEAFERRHGIEPQFRENERGERERSNVTSWVGASVTAYLTAGQIEAIRRDPDVRLVTEDAAGSFSSTPLWSPSWHGPAWGELRDWGWHAVQGRSSVLPGSQRRVFVLDSGVAHHEDLAGVVQRVNVDPGHGPESVVGCYGHATHVAGIIGATSGNLQGRVGVYPGVQIVSVTAGPTVPQTSPFLENGVSDCVWHHPADTSQARLTVQQLGLMLDYVFWQTIVWGESAANMAVVNLSANNLQTGAGPVGQATPTNHPKVRALLQPRYVWPGWLHWYASGAVFVQSAGNDRQDTCYQYYSDQSVLQSAAYTPSPGASSADPFDGALVVGAINQFGQAAATNPTNGWPTGFFSTNHPDMQTWSGPFQHSGVNGTAWGSCIDLWAPGDFIYSTWGRNVYRTKQSEVYAGGQPSWYPFNATTPAGPADAYPGWAWVAGTSMAAPHVAAAAAYVADLHGLQSPALVEHYLRSFHTQWINGLRIPRLQ